MSGGRRIRTGDRRAQHRGLARPLIHSSLRPPNPEREACQALCCVVSWQKRPAVGVAWSSVLGILHP